MISTKGRDRPLLLNVEKAKKLRRGLAVLLDELTEVVIYQMILAL